MGGVDEETMMEGLSKTMVRGKQNDTDSGVMKNDRIYMTHKVKIVVIDCARLRVRALAMAAHGTPSFLNISSNVLKATGLTKLRFRLRQCIRGTSAGA